MRIFKFNNWKYGKSLLADAGSVQQFPGYFFEAEVHATDFYELIFWESGPGHLMLDDRKINLTPGMVIFIAPFRKRRWFVSKKTSQCRFLLFREEFISGYLKNPLFLYELPFFYRQYPHDHFPVAGEWQTLVDILEKITVEIKGFHNSAGTMLPSLVVYLLNIAARSYRQQHGMAHPLKGLGLAHQFRYLLESDLEASKGVAYYAQRLGTSRITLNKYCNSLFGINAGELIRQRLVFEIKSGLLYTNRTINEIADSLGFREPANLSRFFKQFTGSTPSEYRRMYQGGLYFG
ncbi:MAG: helix-turn-helix transcriptional regulator [Ferruginibacter sp.]